MDMQACPLGSLPAGISWHMERGSVCYEGAMMAGERFKERIRQEAIKEAKRYKEIYVDYEYLICSEAFVKRKYYIINAEKDNFQHLTGVHSKINAQEFFDKCVDGSLSEQDFDFVKKGQDEKSVKGTVRRKIRALPEMMDLFREGLQAEEGFKKNKIVCSFAAADSNCTLGFTDSAKARPKSLIWGNELKNPKLVELVLKRKSGAGLFDQVVIGSREVLNKYRGQIEGIVDKALLR